jgi:tRNA A-37 threonylcarbamoyl transferase component Bud32
MPRATSPPECNSIAKRDQVLDRFEATWQKGTRPDIDEFLSSGRSSRQHLLAELVMIDLEYRWRSSPPKEIGPFPVRPRLEAYLEHFPDLASLLSAELIGEEYRVRHRWGDRPDHVEYLRRFPRHAVRLESELARIDAELDSDRCTRNIRAGAVKESTPAPGKSTPLHCPHCRQSIQIPANALPRDFACSACGGAFSLESLSTHSGQSVQPPFPRLGRYELGELLGTGAFGSVWRARDTELGREVAVKIPRSGQFLEPAEEERFLREARSASRLQHPGIVAIHDIGRDQDTLYIVSELVIGTTLAEGLRRERPSFRESAGLTALVADALEFAHQRGVIHRDVKPSNIMVSGEAQSWEQASSMVPRLLDFGLALGNAGDVTMTMDGQVLGTPAYMSPEQVRNPHAVDGRSDVYSLGVILYELLTGELPFRGMIRMVLEQVLTEEPRPPRRLNDRIPRDLETICLQCLAKEPGERYHTAAALALDLRRWLAGEPIRARPVSRLQRCWLWARRNPVPTMSTSLAVVALFATAGIPASLVVLALTALSIGAVVFALYKAKTGSELAQAMAFAGADRRKAAAALNVSLKQCLQARQERDRSVSAAARAKRRFAALRKLAKAFLFELPEKIERANPTPARLFVTQTALTYLDSLAKEAHGDPLLLREAAVAYARVGDLQKDSRAALVSYRRSLELFADLAQNLPLNNQAQRDWTAAVARVRELERALRSELEAINQR